MTKKTIFLIIGAIAIAGAILALWTLWPKKPIEQVAVVIGTGSTAGTYFPLGTAMAKIFNTYLENVVSSAVVSQGSIDNVNMIENKGIQLGFAQNDIVYYAFQGVRMFEQNKKESLRGIATLYPEVIHLILRGDSQIVDLGELVGQKIGMGPQGSGTAVNAEQILKAYGIYEKILPVYLTFDEATDQVANGNIAAAFLTIGTPAKAVTDLGERTGVKILPIGQEIIETLKEDYPFYTKVTIPGGTYKGEPNERETVAVKAMLVVHKDLDSDLVYSLARAIYTHLDVLAQAHPKGEIISLNTALEGMPISLHPGAERFFEAAMRK